MRIREILSKLNSIKTKEINLHISNTNALLNFDTQDHKDTANKDASEVTDKNETSEY